jgi:hypothetical protein
MTKDNFLPDYTTYNSTSNYNESIPSSLWTQTDMNNAGVTSGKGVIKGLVMNTGNWSAMSGVVITYTSALGNTYQVKYLNPSSGYVTGPATFENGFFYIVDVVEGDTVTVNATKTGWNFASRAYITHANSTVSSLIRGGVPASVTIPLTTGWNLISVPIQPSNTAIATVLNTISGSYTIVWAYMNGAWKLYDPSDVEGSTLTTMEAGAGYWIKMASAKTLAISGTTAPASISLVSGWNLTGYNKTVKADASTVLNSIANKYTIVWSYMNGVWKLYDPSDVEGSTLTEFLPNYGYWIKTTQAVTWSQ